MTQKQKPDVAPPAAKPAPLPSPQLLEWRIQQLEKQLDTMSGNAEKLHAEIRQQEDYIRESFDWHLSYISTIAVFFTAIALLLTFFGYRNINDIISNMIERKEKEIDEIIKGFNKELKDHDSKVDDKLDIQNKSIEALKLLQQADKCYGEQQYDAAIGVLDKAIKLVPKHAGAYCNRGSVKSAIKRYDAAILDYDKAIKLDPRNAAAYYNRGLVKVSIQQYDAAIADFSKAIEFAPKYVDAHFNRGLARYVLQQYDAAIADFDKAIELDPKYAGAYFYRACTYSLLGDVKAALADLANSIKLDDSCKKLASEDDNFTSMKDNPEFRKLVGLD